MASTSEIGWSRKYGWTTPFHAHGARRSTAGCSEVSEVWWRFDQVVPTLLRNSVWSAIVLVPSYTRKMKPRARHRRPKNLKIKRIMASCGFEGVGVARLPNTPLGGLVQLSRRGPLAIVDEACGEPKDGDRNRPHRLDRRFGRS